MGQHISSPTSSFDEETIVLSGHERVILSAHSLLRNVLQFVGPSRHLQSMSVVCKEWHEVISSMMSKHEIIFFVGGFFNDGTYVYDPIAKRCSSVPRLRLSEKCSVDWTIAISPSRLIALISRRDGDALITCDSTKPLQWEDIEVPDIGYRYAGFVPMVMVMVMVLTVVVIASRDPPL